MKLSDISKKNTEVILESIISSNKKLYTKLNDEFPELTLTQLKTVLLLKLDYSFNEVRIILGVTHSSILEVYDLLVDSI